MIDAQRIAENIIDQIIGRVVGSYGRDTRIKIVECIVRELMTEDLPKQIAEAIAADFAVKRPSDYSKEGIRKGLRHVGRERAEKLCWAYLQELEAMPQGP
jgi:hypothetical protein